MPIPQHHGSSRTLAVLVVLPVVLAATGQTACAEEPAAKQIAYSRTAGGAPGLFRVATASGAVQRLTTGRDEAPAWSPDGKRLAFIRSRDQGRSFELYVTTAAGARTRRLTHGGGYAGAPVWRPDGSRIVFSASGGAFGTSKDPSCAPNLWSIRADGTGLHRLLRRGVQPAVSPDGRRLAFVRPDAQERPWLYLATADGHGARRIGIGAHPSWSPDSRRMVVNRYVGANRMGDLWTIRADDGRAVRRTRTPAVSEVDPDWSTDGSRIAFSMWRGGHQEIFTMAASGGTAVRATNAARDTGAQEPAWRPAQPGVTG